MKTQAAILKIKALPLTYFLAILFFLIYFLPASSWCRMVPVSDSELSKTYARGMSLMSDQELSDVNGQAGFSKFTLTPRPDNKYQVRADLDIEIQIWAHIDEMKLGYYDFQGQTGVVVPLLGWMAGLNNGYNWDLNWAGVDLGTENDPLVLNGLVIRADFQEVNGNKVLNRFILGSDRVKGSLRADDLYSFTGQMNTKLAPGSLASWLNLDLWANRTNVLNGPGGILAACGDIAEMGMVFDNNGFYLVFDRILGVGAWAGFPISDIED
ncbi:hypothetical protein MHK_002988 [Candidatus Magnetomorum sp. HK-1]|nr:hypothetical protein MHK_002988 [Candidatus Magnetomorum sp. HK-1]